MNFGFTAQTTVEAVTKMSLSRQTLKRLPQIKQGFRKGDSYEQIASACDVHHRTIERDVQSWVESGLFEVWIKEEFVDLHNYARTANPMEAYKQIAKIIGKMVTHKLEAKETIDVTTRHIIVKMWKPIDEPTT